MREGSGRRLLGRQRPDVVPGCKGAGWGVTVNRVCDERRVGCWRGIGGGKRESSTGWVDSRAVAGEVSRVFLTFLRAGRAVSEPASLIKRKTNQGAGLWRDARVSGVREGRCWRQSPMEWEVREGVHGECGD